MLANIWLRVHDHAAVEWPEETIGTTSVIRREYIDAIQAADEGDYERLMGIHKRFVREES